MSTHQFALVSLQHAGELAVLRIANPPVNAISDAVVEDLCAALDRFDAASDAKALVIACEGRTFVAGGDISAFDDPAFSTQPFNRVLARIEAQSRPVVAALHGTVLGGGMELALACHWRVAGEGTLFGFPEVRLGLLPGSLGTQRLPRLAGVAVAYDLIGSGRSIDAASALYAGIIDAIVPDGTVVDAAVRFARDTSTDHVETRRLSKRSVDSASLPADFFSVHARKAKDEQAAYPAAIAIVQALEAAATRPFETGERIEAQLFQELLSTRTSRALRHLFYAQREAAKIPGLTSGARPVSIETVGVLGAGTMGRGIAMNFLAVGIPVVLLETSPEALDRAVASVRSLYEESAAKGKLSAVEVERRMGLLRGSLSLDALASCDLVIEAVFEDMALKKQVCAQLGRACKPGAIIATNTSTLDVDAIAHSTGRAGDVVGMHFFSPANVMRLLEVVRGSATKPAVLATVMQLARRIGKVAVVSGVCYGFIGNRMAEVYMREAEFLLLEGATPAQVDGAVEAFGMAMGPCRMLDMAGIDVGAKTVIEYGKAGGLPPDPSYRAMAQALFAMGRFGQKTGAGYYRYEGRRALPDPETQRIVAELAAKHRIARRTDISSQEIVERLLYPMVNEAAKILDEGIAYRGSDIDVVWTAGYGFPDHQGGPLFMADEIGLPVVVEQLSRYGRQRGNSFGYWTVSPLLGSLAAEGGRISNWKKR